MMLDLCYICGRPATHRCRMCGKAVCDIHYVPELGLCVKCASGYGKRF